jgi:hypothetical protein
MPLFFRPYLFLIFVLRSKRKNMLKGISWGQFTVFILLATVGYYLYVGVRFFGSEIIGKIGRRKLGGERVDDAKAITRFGKSDHGGGTVPEVDQAELFERSDKIAEGNELFKAMEHAIGVLRELVAWAVANKLDRDNLLDHVHEVLAKYRQLKGTDYAGTINNYLVRVCSSEFSLQLAEAELAELWK